MTRLITPDERAAVLGERVGRSAANAAQRLRSLASDNFRMPAGEGEPSSEAGDGRTQRAEYLVNSIESTAVTYSRVVGDRLRRAFARAREEIEDVVAEAQSRRSAGGRSPAGDDEDIVAPS